MARGGSRNVTVLCFFVLTPLFITCMTNLIATSYERIRAMSKCYSVLVMGTVERRVTVTGKSLAEIEANACAEWTSLTGGYIGTAECIEADELEVDWENWDD